MSVDTPIFDKLVNFIVDATGVDSDEISLNTPLFTSGIVDSMNFLNLIDFVEKNFDIKTEISEISLERWDSIGLILTFIESKKS